MCYVKNAKKIIVIARLPGLGSGRGTACARFNCTRLCRRSAVARNSPRAFARRVYEETPVAETITQPVVVGLRKEIVSCGF